jgi:hypothetical protein
MSNVMVRYTVRPECAQENAELVRAVYEELARERPDGLRYATFVLDDGVTFVHVASHGEENPLPAVAAFQEFTRDIGARCAVAPAVSSMQEVGSFRFWE